jgi:hypothetical protein
VIEQAKVIARELAPSLPATEQAVMEEVRTLQVRVSQLVKSV